MDGAGEGRTAEASSKQQFIDPLMELRGVAPECAFAARSAACALQTQSLNAGAIRDRGGSEPDPARYANWETSPLLGRCLNTGKREMRTDYPIFLWFNWTTFGREFDGEPCFPRRQWRMTQSVSQPKQPRVWSFVRRCYG